MKTINDLTLLGSGATANVYLYDNDKILKLFNKSYDLGSVEYESKIAQEVNKSNIKAPRYNQTIQVNDQYGIIYEYISGDLLVSLLLKSSLSQGISLIKELAKTQLSINAVNNRNITTQIDRLSYLINRATNIDQYKDELISGLRLLKQDCFICHGDLHAGNVIVNNSCFITIDWMNCYTGNKEGDLLRSYLMLITPYIPFSMGPFKKLLFKIYKRLLGHVYMKEYLSISGLKKRELKKWYPIIAAARLADNVPNEEQWLLKLIRKNIKYLTTAST